MGKRMKSSEKQASNEIALLLKQLVAIELWNAGLSQGAIGKRLGVATATANKFVKGLPRTGN
ncbi:MAG TPA: hypothetical protein VI750_13880 [Pyrinomonadaceae bacterium]|nr:hypothetical protein [Pyrinomonadaceae bacterium]